MYRRETRWTRYFTPAALGDDLVHWLDIPQGANSAVDICAGHGHLLSSVKKRWPQSILTANDILDFGPQAPNLEFARRVTGDGREFAVRAKKDGIEFDVVVANPPFGSEVPISETALEGLKEDRVTEKLLRSSRLEAAMITASALLVGPNGVLAAIVPETLVFGETHQGLRRWMAQRFRRFQVKRIPRGDFRQQDLGLVFLAAYRSGEFSEEELMSFVNGGTQTEQSTIEIHRGRLVSSETASRGGISVVHCGGKRAQDGFVYRRCKKSLVTTRQHVWIEAGDLIATRVGRRAGQLAIYSGPEAVLTDCMFKITLRGEYKALGNSTNVGDVSKLARSKAIGLGASYCTKKILLWAIRSVFEKEGWRPIGDQHAAKRHVSPVHPGSKTP